MRLLFEGLRFTWNLSLPTQCSKPSQNKPELRSSGWDDVIPRIHQHLEVTELLHISLFRLFDVDRRPVLAISRWARRRDTGLCSTRISFFSKISGLAHRYWQLHGGRETATKYSRWNELPLSSQNTVQGCHTRLGFSTLQFSTFWVEWVSKEGAIQTLSLHVTSETYVTE